MHRVCVCAGGGGGGGGEVGRLCACPDLDLVWKGLTCPGVVGCSYSFITYYRY